MSEDIDEDWVAAGQPEPEAAEYVRAGEEPCGYDDCTNDAEYFVEFRAIGGSRSWVYMCDDCSQDNLIWVRENDLLDREVTVDR